MCRSPPAQETEGSLGESLARGVAEGLRAVATVGTWLVVTFAVQPGSGGSTAGWRRTVWVAGAPGRMRRTAVPLVGLRPTHPVDSGRSQGLQSRPRRPPPGGGKGLTTENPHKERRGTLESGNNDCVYSSGSGPLDFQCVDHSLPDRLELGVEETGLRDRFPNQFHPFNTLSSVPPSPGPGGDECESSHHGRHGWTHATLHGRGFDRGGHPRCTLVPLDGQDEG